MAGNDPQFVSDVRYAVYKDRETKNRYNKQYEGHNAGSDYRTGKKQYKQKLDSYW